MIILSKILKIISLSFIASIIFTICFVLPFCIFLVIIFDPASPNPIASSAPIFMIVDSSVLVSSPYCSAISKYFTLFFFISYSAIAFSSEIFAAYNGLSAIYLIF